MTDFLIPDVDDEVIAALARRAVAKGTSVEQEARIVLVASTGSAGDAGASAKDD